MGCLFVPGTVLEPQYTFSLHLLPNSDKYILSSFDNREIKLIPSFYKIKTNLYRGKKAYLLLPRARSGRRGGLHKDLKAVALIPPSQSSQVESSRYLFLLILYGFFYLTYKVLMKWSEVTQSCLTLCDPMDCSLRGSSVHGIFQEIFLTQRLNPGLPHCRQTLYRLSHQGSKVLITGSKSSRTWCSVPLSSHWLPWIYVILKEALLRYNSHTI